MCASHVRHTPLQAEERIAAAAAAAAGAVVASESIKWRARTERLESERRQQLIQHRELKQRLGAAQKELRACEAELTEEKERSGVDSSDALNRWARLGHGV